MKVIFYLGMLCLMFSIGCTTIIDVTKYPKTRIHKNTYLQKGTDFSLSLITTGYSKSLEAFIYRGGSLFKSKKIAYTAVFIEHPKGNLIFDTGLGTAIDLQVRNNLSYFERSIVNYKKLTTVKKALSENGLASDVIKFIIPSHFHWDHVSALSDFQTSAVWVTSAEDDYIFSNEAKTPNFIKTQYNSKTIPWKIIKFNQIPYEVFIESLDIYRDGSLILVPLPGHTVGSVGLFVNLKSGTRYFFTGDLTWSLKALKRPSEKHSIPKKHVDYNAELVEKNIVKIKYLMQQKPNLIIVPAHDFEAQQHIAQFPNREN
jgi:glyoxylase-like metal-dependent hydrolase (beta-lactamase superfamily II)